MEKMEEMEEMEETEVTSSVSPSTAAHGRRQIRRMKEGRWRGGDPRLWRALGEGFKLLGTVGEGFQLLGAMEGGPWEVCRALKDGGP